LPLQSARWCETTAPPIRTQDKSHRANGGHQRGDQYDGHDRLHGYAECDGSPEIEGGTDEQGCQDYTSSEPPCHHGVDERQSDQKRHRKQQHEYEEGSLNRVLHPGNDDALAEAHLLKRHRVIGSVSSTSTTTSIGIAHVRQVVSGGNNLGGFGIHLGGLKRRCIPEWVRGAAGGLWGRLRWFCLEGLSKPSPAV
jgi:hypothetical protein